MIEIGKYAKLTVIKSVDKGYMLANKHEEEVLLPFKSLPEEIHIGDKITVFVYKNSSNSLCFF